MLMTGSGVLFVDWQRLIRFHGACDVACFLAGSLTIADRREHKDALLRRYNERLLQAAVTEYTWETCRRHYREAMVHWLGLITVASLLDVADARGEALIATMVERQYTAAADHDALAFVS